MILLEVCLHPGSFALRVHPAQLHGKLSSGCARMPLDWKKAALLLPALQAVCGLLRVLLRIPKYKTATSKSPGEIRNPPPGLGYQVTMAWSSVESATVRWKTFGFRAQELATALLHADLLGCVVSTTLQQGRSHWDRAVQMTWVMTCFIRYAISTCNMSDPSWSCGFRPWPLRVIALLVLPWLREAIMTYPDCSPLVRLSLAGLLNLFFFKVHASELNTWNLTIWSRSCWLIHHHTPKGFWAILVSFRSIKIIQNRTFSDIKFSHSTKSNGQVQAWDHWIDNTALRAAYLVEADLGFAQRDVILEPCSHWFWWFWKLRLYL